MFAWYGYFSLSYWKDGSVLLSCSRGWWHISVNF